MLNFYHLTLFLLKKEETKETTCINRRMYNNSKKCPVISEVTNHLRCRPLTQPGVWQPGVWRQTKALGCEVESLCSNTPKWTKQPFECCKTQETEKISRVYITDDLYRIRELIIILDPLTVVL